MSELDLNRLKQYRDEILKAEIGALLFNLGKTHIGIGFWKKYFPKETQLFQGYSDYFNEYAKYFFEELNEKDENIKIFFQNIQIDIDDILSLPIIELLKGQKSDVKFVKNIFFQGCENVNSAIDKNFPNDIRIEPYLFLTNAFGALKEEIKKEKFDSTRINFYSKLFDFLKEKNYFHNPNWLEIRELILLEIENWYSHLLSDSRFPINDVSLFDQAYMTASMFKAILAQVIIDNSKLEKYQNNPSSIKWRILGVQYDKFGITEKSLKLASIRKYKEITEEIDKEIKNLLEVEYPIGNEIYKDETGIYFIVGEDLGKDLDDGSNLAKLNDNLEIEQKILEIFKEKTDDEFYPSIFLTKASRGLMNLSTLLESAKKNFLRVNWKKKNKDLCLVRTEYGKAIGICPVCQMRLIYEKDKERNNSPIICDFCDSRIHHSQVSSWIKNINNETIWIDEIKDKNNRIAYLSLKFELKDWLSGDLANSLLGNLGDSNIQWEEQKRYLQNYILNKFEPLNNESDKIFSIFVENCKKIKTFTNEILQIINDVRNIKLSSENIQIIEKIKKDYINKISSDENIFDCNDLFSIIKVNHIILGLMNFLHRKKDDLNNNPEIYSNLEKIKEISKELKDLIEKSGNQFAKYENQILKIYPFSINPELKQYYHKYSSFKSFLEFILFNNVETTKWEDFIKSQLSNPNAIDYENRTIAWNLLNNDDIEFLSTLILQFLLRKNPSPARLRRIWESTQEFFENVHKNLDDILEIPEWRKKRLVWEIDLDDNNTLDKSRELEGSGLLFWVEKNGNKAKIYLISSIEDFIERFGNKENKNLLLEKLNSENVDLNEIKEYLNDFEISLKQYSESKNRGEGEILITLTKDSSSQIHSYKPYSLITDTSPVNYQVIIPASSLPNFIDVVIKRYNENFKYVYGKLPIHIGIVVSDYKKPVYVNLKALRNIRRDVNSDELWVEKNVNDFCQLQRQKLSFEKKEEKNNDTEKYYALYFNNPDRKDYQFFIKPDNNWKYWISTTEKFPFGSKIKMIPNTLDFEFMDTDTRRNDIYYESSNKGYKRALDIKSNRPYEIEIYWGKFKKFKELFKDKANTAKMYKLVSLFYEKLQNYDKKYKPLLASAIINILELRKNKDFLEDIQIIFDLNRENDIQKELIEKLDKEKLKLFIDMFEFWHTALKEI